MSQMSYRWIEHTAEVELHIEAASEQAVFADALAALSELIGEDTEGTSVSREVALAARDRAALLAAWLDELIYLLETEDLVPDLVERLELHDTTLAATVRAHRGRPRHLVKGATYHELAFEGSEKGFRATVVLDV
jgi:SHS2 domain-containing protein